MAKLIKGLFGSSDQERALKQQNADLQAAEAGQQRLREGGRGLLAFIDDQLTTLGGGRGLLKNLGGTG